MKQLEQLTDALQAIIAIEKRTGMQLGLPVISATELLSLLPVVHSFKFCITTFIQPWSRQSHVNMFRYPFMLQCNICSHVSVYETPQHFPLVDTTCVCETPGHLLIKWATK